MGTGVRIKVGQVQSEAKLRRFPNQVSDSLSETMRLIVKGAETETQAKYRQRYVSSRKCVQKFVEEKGEGKTLSDTNWPHERGSWKYLPSTCT
jgi:hypothetical protein